MSILSTQEIGDFRNHLFSEIQFVRRAETRDDEAPLRRNPSLQRRTPTRRAVRAAQLLSGHQSSERRRELFRVAANSIESETGLKKILPVLESSIRGHVIFLQMVVAGGSPEMALDESGVSAAMDKLLWYLPPEATPKPEDPPKDIKDKPKDKTKKIPTDSKTIRAITYVNDFRKKVAKGECQPMDLRDIVAEFAGDSGEKEVNRLYRALQPDRHGGHLT